jgi:hypothetical protein
MARRHWFWSVLVTLMALGLVVPGGIANANPPAPQAAAASADPAVSQATVLLGGIGPHQPDRLSITSASNPYPNFVSGGQVLLRLMVPARDGQAVRVTLNGRLVSAAFQRQADGSLLGLVTGLRTGRNLVAATAGRDRTSLMVDNHPITGPVFSGPQQTPFYCETTAFGLAPAVQPLCSAPTMVSYVYKNTSGAFVPLADPTSRPADLASATVNGRAVPYIVRVEAGTIDRAVYQTAALYDGSDPSPYRPDTAWNDKLIYAFGGGCNAGFHQGASTGGVLVDLFLSQGYAVASSSLNVLDNNCSAIISAEAAMMVKEHFIETYGPVQHTIGWGGSGGAIQQYQIAEMYPGILDGIIPGVSFPDPFTVLAPVTDCRLLNTFFAGAGSSFSTAARTAIAGFPTYDTCLSWDATFASRATATQSCPAAIPVAARWDPVTNPTGIKCAAAEQFANQFGTNPQTGFVRTTLDNVGVQYGLDALESGAITPAQFAELNADIGGMDYTGALQPERTVGDPKALAAAYADDLMNSASQGLKTTPIIDQRTDLDFAGFGNDIHTSDWSYVMRARLQQANGTAANQVIIANEPTGEQLAAASVYELAAMDQWLTNIAADATHRSQQQKVIADKPFGLGDGCYLSATNRIVEPLTDPASGQCGAMYPVAANTRLTAGQSLTETVLKCRLKPLDFADYAPVSFTATEQAELEQAFPQGVCDYSRPGVGPQRPRGVWLDYSSRGRS